MKESDLQYAIKQWLELKGFLVVKFSSVGIFKKSTQSYIRQPRRGVSDLLACSPTGQFWAIECKVGSNKATPEQLEFLAQVEKNGGVAIVARKLEDVSDKLLEVVNIMNIKCKCACHENKLERPYEHVLRCCNKMNGYLAEEESQYEGEPRFLGRTEKKAVKLNELIRIFNSHIRARKEEK